MQKVLLIFFTLPILGFTPLQTNDTNTDHDPEANCITKATILLEAEANYKDDPSPENCVAYKTAIKNYKNSECKGGDNYTDELKALNNCIKS